MGAQRVMITQAALDGGFIGMVGRRCSTEGNARGEDKNSSSQTVV